MIYAGEAPMWMLDIAKVLGTIAAIFASITIICRTKYINKPIKAVWRALITQPLEIWIIALVDKVVNDRLFEPDRGSSLADISKRQSRTNQELIKLRREIYGDFHQPENDNS